MVCATMQMQICYIKVLSNTSRCTYNSHFSHSPSLPLFLPPLPLPSLAPLPLTLHVHVHTTHIFLPLSLLSSPSHPLIDSITSHTAEDEEEEDGEYNFLADCLREEEREEFRNDRAVRIPRKNTILNIAQYTHINVY